MEANNNLSTLTSQNSKFAVKIINTKAKKDIKPVDGKSSITVKQFLGFLKTAYQVQENIEDILLANGMQEAVDWIKLKESELIRTDFSCQTSQTNLTDNEKCLKNVTVDSTAEQSLQNKLNEALSEGILDSVLPYLLPQPRQKSRCNMQSSQHKLTEKASHQSHVSNHSSKSQKRSPTPANNKPPTRRDSEVLIHVCDEVKNMKKDFVCNQKLLVEKMGYFAQVTAGQKLEDMDISVHCDISIFEWLMSWVKSSDVEDTEPPTLDPHCVVPIAISASFLQMEPLLQDCLLFMHSQMNEILRSPTNMSCLNDAILTRLGAMYTNSEVESIRDRKDKIQSRLYCKLIQSMCEPEPESVRGHWSSMAYMYQCSKCHQIITPTVAPNIRCAMSCIRLQPDGELISRHVRDAHWNINDFIRRLHKNLRTWRRIYWRLWGNCHFLYCIICKTCFPAHQIGWCRYHPDPPQFFTVDAHKAPLPIGRFPCCGERAYRFQLFDSNLGCKFREHCPSTENVRDVGVLETLERYRHLIEEEPPELIFPERLTRLIARDASNTSGKLQIEGTKFWWDGLELTPPRPRLGLLGTFTDLTPEEAVKHAVEESPCSSSSSQTSDTSTIFDSDGAEERYSISSPRSKPKKTPKRRKKKKKAQSGKFWQNKLSARSNQDLQRTYEETAFKKMGVTLQRRSYVADNGKKLLTGKPWPRYITPPGGIWIRLEAEWKEANNYSQIKKPLTEYTYNRQKLRYPKPS
ncbi:uncharacterized protein KIAA1841 homolog [Agrilus planipennis]|uniref:Uncharacterized protein KIAA1841 homolog n=1 Tax=Agrilus planipennis TaxID=224129 RepID=A0A1W4WSU5_AGRPL|nr:uncharacterized protein KIAA1841 homolog [Agrilus planipennis]XP_018323566.1 uncharacterized protein KIAA1841 homolog [Agrilus planipennis]XP_018323567.1 uncharacterized protein KIAA1841 homolog [Agrilus planipennis]